MRGTCYVQNWNRVKLDFNSLKLIYLIKSNMLIIYLTKLFTPLFLIFTFCNEIVCSYCLFSPQLHLSSFYGKGSSHLSLQTKHYKLFLPPFIRSSHLTLNCSCSLFLETTLLGDLMCAFLNIQWDLSEIYIFLLVFLHQLQKIPQLYKLKRKVKSGRVVTVQLQLNRKDTITVFKCLETLERSIFLSYL